MLTDYTPGGYRFLPAISAYSAGVAAAPGFAILHVRLLRPVAWKKGFESIDRHLRSAGRTPHALCAVALRSPQPFSFAGFKEFNAQYVEVLREWGIVRDGVNPVARTNVAPEVSPPAEPSLYSFAYTVPAAGAPVSFVVAGAGEIPEGSRGPEAVVRRGETTADAIAAKARCVLGLMEGRLSGLGVSWNDVTVSNIYTVHDVNGLLAAEILPRLGPAREHGIVWHFARPPIVSIEYEMDVRGCARESVLAI
jgi:hypothetical protein